MDFPPVQVSGIRAIEVVKSHVQYEMGPYALNCGYACGKGDSTYLKGVVVQKFADVGFSFGIPLCRAYHRVLGLHGCVADKNACCHIIVMHGRRYRQVRFKLRE
jgi:hypothetical protein